jgi:tRNA-guanine family transglycosylase
LVDSGQLNLSKQIYEKDHRVIDDKCICSVCQSGYTRSYLNTIVTKETTACHLLTIHNVAYQVRLFLFILFNKIYLNLDEINVENSSINCGPTFSRFYKRICCNLF